MYKNIFVLALITGLLATNCQALDEGGQSNITNNTNTTQPTTGGGGANTTQGNMTNETVSGSNMTAEQALTWLGNYISILEPTVLPSNVAENFEALIGDIRSATLGLNKLAAIMANKSSSNQIQDLANLTETWKNIKDLEYGIFAIVSNWLLILESAQDRVDCYDRFYNGDLQSYVGIDTLTQSFFSNESTSDSSSKLENLTYYCTVEQDKNVRLMDDFFKILLGEDEKCDLIKDAYAGNVQLQVWTGWREMIADVVGYMFLDTWWLQMTSSACLSLNGVTDAAENVTAKYQERISQLINRYKEFSNKTYSEINQTIFENVQALISINEDVSPFVTAVNIDYTIPVLYPDYDTLIFVFSANVTNDEFSVQCKNCTKIFQQNGLNVVYAYVSKNTTSSIGNGTLDQNATTPADVVNSVLQSNNCTLGVIAINQDVDQYLIQYLDDRYKTINSTSGLNVYIWGVQEECL